LFFPAPWYSVFPRLSQRKEDQPPPEAKRLFLGLASMKTLGSLIRPRVEAELSGSPIRRLFRSSASLSRLIRDVTPSDLFVT
jgi:hypothetical protein